ncbi:hypothetical protein HKD37_20G056800 [Glycine soja]
MGAHGRLKRLLRDSTRDLNNCWDAMNNMVVLQHTTIKASFRKNINVVEHKFNTPVYKLHDFVSREAQDLIFHELQWVNTFVKSIKRKPSMWEHVNEMNTMIGSSRTPTVARKERLLELITFLYIEHGSVPYEKWMTIPDIGYVIASQYNIVLVHLSRLQSWTFFLLRRLMPTKPSLISIGLVNENYFVQYIIYTKHTIYLYKLILIFSLTLSCVCMIMKLFLKDRYPLPPVVPQWRNYCTVEAHSWHRPYNQSIQDFNTIQLQ